MSGSDAAADDDDDDERKATMKPNRTPTESFTVAGSPDDITALLDVPVS